MARQTYTWNDVRLSKEQVAQVLWQTGITDLNVIAQLIPIAMRESGGRAGVHGSDSPQSRVSGDRGLFQINSVHDARLKAAGVITKPEDLFDPVVNARAAAYLSNQGDPRVMRQLWGLGIMPNGQRGWVGSSGDLPTPDTGAVQRAQSSGILGQPFAGGNYVPSAITSGAASAAAGPLANPGTAELGLVNANAQNQRQYYIDQEGFNKSIWELGVKGNDLQLLELDANKLFQWNLNNIYTDVNAAQGVFNTREFEEMKRNVGVLKDLAAKGLAETAEYTGLQRELEAQTLNATNKWLAEKGVLIDRQYGQQVSEADFVRQEQRREYTSEATAKGAMTSRGYGQDLAASNQQRGLAVGAAGISRDEAEGQRQLDKTQAWIGYQGNMGQINQGWNQYQNQYAAQQEGFLNTLAQGSLRYDQTAKQLWAKARELSEQQKLNDQQTDINYKSLLNQRDVNYQQYLQSHSSLKNQHTQVGVNQLRDISSLNQARQAASNQALLSLSPYG